MFYPAAPAQVYIAPGVTDMRKSINGLSLLVADQLELSPLSGLLFGVSFLVYLLSATGSGIWSKSSTGTVADSASGINDWKRIASAGLKL